MVRRARWILVITAFGVLSTAAVLLRTLHADVREDRLQQHLARGYQLSADNALEQAAAEFRAALLLERDHREAGRALALTLLSLGDIAESESHLRELLREDPTNGPLNRGLARIHAIRGREAEARASYQRAIYGEWPGDAVAGRVETRFELIDYLTRLGADNDVLAELLRLRAELPSGHTESARRAADLLVTSGAPDLAIETLRTARLTAPRDLDLLAHLADLQSGAGRPAEARATLREAVGIEPRADLKDRLQVVDRVLALDPTLPQLGLVARTRRARLVLSQVVDHARGCVANGTPALEELLSDARGRVRRTVRADAEVAEQDLALAAQIWAAAPECHGTSATGRAIAQVLGRVAGTGAEPEK